MKKLQSLILLLCILFSFTGCEATQLDSNTSVATTTTYASQQKALSKLKVHYIDVGQGDSELLQCNGVNILIDTGESDQAQHLIQYLEQQGVTTIDYLFLTHPHTDHMGGAVKLMEHFPVKQVYLTNRTHTTVSYRKLIETIKNKNIKRVQAKAGTSIAFTKQLKGLIVAPNHLYDDINASSIVLKVTYGKNSFLFTGDATIETEQDILNDGYDISADVYKVSHHGSSTSNSVRFIDAINPSICVIEVGANNSYGHPHKEVQELLSNRKTTVYRTDKNGSIVITSNGKTLSVSSSKGKGTTSSSASKKPTTTNTSKNIVYIGNKNSKVYHKSTCSSLPDKKNQVSFSSKSSAEQAGYHACSRCNP